MDVFFSFENPVQERRRLGGFEVFSTPDDVQTVHATPVSVGVKIGHPSIFLSSQNARAFTIFINSVDRSEYVLAARDPFTITYQSESGSRGSASLRIFDRTGNYRPNCDEEVLIYENETFSLLFGGKITGTEEEHYTGLAAHEIRVDCSDWGTNLDRAIVSAYFESITIIWSPLTMINEILREYIPETGISADFGASADGTAFSTEVLFPHWTGTQAIKSVCERDGLDYFVDPHKKLHLINTVIGYGNAPFNIADNDGNFDKMTVKIDGTKYANWVGVRSDVREPPFWHEIFTGNVDGRRYFITKYRVSNKPVVVVNGSIKIVIAYGAYSPVPHDFSYVPNGYGVFSNPNQAPYTTSDTIHVYYPGPLQPITIAKDDVEIALYGRVSTVIDVKDTWDPILLQEIADGWLARLKVKPSIVNFTTKRTGLLPGQLINISTTRPLVSNLDLVISSVTGTCVGRKTLDTTLSVGKQARMVWQIKCSNQAVQGQANYERMILTLRQARVQAQDHSRLTISVDLAVDIQGLTNPGLAAIVVPTAREVDQFGFLKEVRLRFDDPPLNTTIQIDVYRNGVSVFALGEYIEFSPSDAGTTIVKYLFETVPYPVQDGDQFTVEVITADDTAKNGKLEIEIQH